MHTPLLVRWCVLGGLALAVAGWDLRRRVIPNALVAIGLGAGTVGAALSGSLGAALLGAAVFGGPLILLWLAGVAAGAQGLVGAGDAKAALAFGAVLGMPGALSGLWWGAVIGGVLALASVGGGLWADRRALAGSLRRGGAGACLAAIAADPAWSRGIPYGAALAAGSLVAAAGLWR